MKKSILALAAVSAISGGLYAKDSDLALKKVMLYSSGVGYYEFDGNLEKESKIDLYFTQDQIRDVLKSITVSSKSVNSLQFDYELPNAYLNTLDGLRIDPSRALTINSLLSQQRGALINIGNPYNLSGKILSINEINNQYGESIGSSMSILTDDKIVMVDLEKVESLSFADESLNNELKFGLELIYNNASTIHKKLTLNIKSNEKNSAKIGYVMASPAWKISYRLYTQNEKALFQAWAIVDNDTTNDWNDVSLVLVSGKPNSFTQDLYTSYYLSREALNPDGTPIYTAPSYDDNYYQQEQTRKEVAMESSQPMIMADAANAEVFLDDKVFTAKAGDGATEQLSFVIPKTVNLKKSTSMMIPLVSTEVPAEKFSIFTNMQLHKETNPKLALYLKNSSSMKLPSGSITLYDTDGYMGDAYIDYMNINDDKIISFGDDLEVKGTTTSQSTNGVQSISIKGGFVNQTNKTKNITTYNIKNLAQKAKIVVIEHKITDKDVDITADAKAYKTDPNYNRYKFEIPSAGSIKLNVTATKVRSERYYIANLDDDWFSYYASNGEISQKIKDKFKEIADKKSNLRKIEDEIGSLTQAQEKLFASQERSRQNLEAVGRDSSEGEQFLEQILKYDNEIAQNYQKIETLDKKYATMRDEFEKFLRGINI